jgi:signal transduction histidine kinase
MEGFLQNFLKYARPKKPQFRQVEIHAIIREMAYIMNPRLIKNNITLEQVFEPGEIFLNADPDQLKQVLMNLMINSMEAMDEGGKMIVSTRLNSKKGNRHPKWLTIMISDTGTGIPDEVRETLFDPFVKGKATGVGLGLSISQRIIELHHGWIEAANNPEKGASFTIHLPVE